MKISSINFLRHLGALLLDSSVVDVVKKVPSLCTDWWIGKYSNILKKYLCKLQSDSENSKF